MLRANHVQLRWAISFSHNSVLSVEKMQNSWVLIGKETMIINKYGNVFFYSAHLLIRSYIIHWTNVKLIAP
jgi:hypothetical protein